MPNIIYLAINLPASTDRREHILREGNKQGISVQIVEAVAGKTLTAEQQAMYDSKKRESMYHTHLTPNEQACVLSHRKCLQTFLQSDADYAVIVEDDATFEPNFKEGIDYLIQQVKGWEACKLYNEPCKLYPLCPALPDAPVQPVFPKKIPWGSVGYMYSRNAAKKIMEHFESFWLGSDTQLAEIMLTYNIPVIGVTPNLVGTLYTHNEQSDINDGGQRNTPVNKKKRSRIQYLRYRASVIRRAIGKWKMCRHMRCIFKENKVGY